MDSTDGRKARLDPALADAPARALPGTVMVGLHTLLVAAGYYFAARLGLLIPYVGTHVSLVWLPTGIAVAAFRRWGPGMAPAVWLAATAANASIGGPLWVSLGIGAGNTAGTALAAALLRRLGFDDRLLRRRDIGVFLAAVVLGMCVTSLNGVLWLTAAGAPESAHGLQAWISWLVGDSVGALVAGVPLVAWSREGAALAFGGRAGVRNMVLLAIVLACGLTAFSGWLAPDSAFVFPLLALPFFVLAVLAMRGGVVAASIGVLSLSVAAGYGTARGFGPFALHEPRGGSLALWSYIAAQACTSLLICGMGMALQASRRQFEAFLHHCADGILVIDDHGRLLHANAAFAAMIGADAGTLRGRPASEVLCGSAGPIAALVADGAPAAAAELTLAPAGGAPVTVECQVARYRNASGPWQTHVSLRDVTQRRIAQERIAVSETMVRAITDQVPGLISRMDRHYRYTFVNANYVRWFALPESPVGKTVAEVFGEDIFEGVRARLDEALAGGDVVFDLVNKLPGGAEHMQVHYVPDRDDRGEVIGVYGLVTDRTEQQRAHERIEASERQLRAVTDNLPLLITYVDADERLRFMNATFHEWLGVDHASAIGRPLADVVGPENYAARREHLRTALGGRRVEFEIVSRTRQGPRHLQTVYIPDVRDDGRVRGIFTLSTDVSAQKEVERELQRLARVDTLTGLANRRQFDELLEQALARYRRSRRPLALIYLDIDRFKAINDTHGHGVGDAVLCVFADRLRAGLRETDAAARLSGDEFVVLLDGLARRDEAVAVANKLLHAIRVPMAPGDKVLEVSCSMGLAWLAGTLDVDAQQLMARADRALYRAKDGGRNALSVADD